MDRRLNSRDYQEAKKENCGGSSTLLTYLAIKELLHPSLARFRGGTGDGWKGYLIRTHERRRGGDDDSGRWPWRWMQQWTVQSWWGRRCGGVWVGTEFKGPNKERTLKINPTSTHTVRNTWPVSLLLFALCDKCILQGVMDEYLFVLLQGIEEEEEYGSYFSSMCCKI